MANKIMNDVNVSSSPHVRNKLSTRSIMLDVCIALIPALACGVYAADKYWLNALLVIFMSVASCVLSELVFQKLMKRPVTVGDLSAVVTGLILAANLPATVPFWIPLIGGAFAILLVKQLFGGLGQNFMNPALAARCFLVISFAALMTRFPETVRTIWVSAPDAISAATPLEAMRNGETINALHMIFDFHKGCIGEASSLAVMIGAAYLFIRRVITPRIPVTYIVSTIAFIALFQLINGNAELLTVDYLVSQLLGGGLMLGAFFMANDYVTSPVAFAGQYIYALFLGLLTALFRVLGTSSEGVSYAIIIGNCIVPLIDKITIPRPFGRERRARK